VVILELIHANRVPTREGRNAFIRSKPIGRRVSARAHPHLNFGDSE
jgi:hypothetical protein